VKFYELIARRIKGPGNYSFMKEHDKEHGKYKKYCRAFMMS